MFAELFPLLKCLSDATGEMTLKIEKVANADGNLNFYASAQPDPVWTLAGEIFSIHRDSADTPNDNYKFEIKNTVITIEGQQYLVNDFYYYLNGSPLTSEKYIPAVNMTYWQHQTVQNNWMLGCGPLTNTQVVKAVLGERAQF